MRTFARELRHAWRSLVHRKAYFIACAGTLALVLGANAAMFAVVNATMLRPLPFNTRGIVVQLYGQPPGTSTVLQRNPLQQMEVPRLRERARTLARLEGFYLYERVVTLAGEPGVAKGATVTPGLLTMMAAPIAQGRSFRDDEEAPGQFVALITDRYWRTALGSRDVVGSELIVDDQPYTVVGILAREFAPPFLDADVLTPLVSNPDPVRAPPRTVQALAELAPGVSIDQAREELKAISVQLGEEFPRTHSHWTIGAAHFRDWQYGSMQAPLLMLMAATGLVLLIACVNIANLTSAQAIARSSELSLRLALGASKRDVVRMGLAELTIVCVAGLVPGLLLARGAVPALLATNPTIAQTLGEVSIDWRVQAFSAVLAMLSAVAASLLPSMRAMRGDASAVVASNRTTGSARTVRVQRALVSIEVGLCVALLMAGAVVIQGLRNLSERGPGYQAAGVLTAQVRLPEASYKTPQLRASVVNTLLDEIRALPGVESVAMTQNAFVPAFSYQTLLKVPDRPTPDDQPLTVQFRRLSPDYFKTMHIRLIGGRGFTDADSADRPPVAVISRRFADMLMPGLDPIGRPLLRNSPPALTWEIVGIAEDASDVTAAAPAEPTLYLPWAQNNNFGVPVAFVIRTSVEPESLIPALRASLKGVDASLPLRKAQPLAAFVAESTAPERFRMFVLTILAALGLALAALGIAGVTYRSVIDRTKDFAVRLALGAEPAAVIRMVMLESMRDLSIGAIAGLIGGAAICGVLARTLQNVAAVDAVTTGVAIAIVASIGVGAAMLPALRIMRVQPAGVLRS